MITQARLKELLHYDPLTGVFTRLVDCGSRAKKGSVAGHDNGNGYLRVQIDGKDYYCHRLAWLYVHGVMPLNIDHDDGVANHNAISNLRNCSHAENMQNRSVVGKKGNVAGHIGVSWSRSNNMWRADIRSDNKKTLLGYFLTVELAAKAYLKAKSELHAFKPELTR